MEDDLQELESIIAEKARELAGTGFILYGTIRKHYMKCGTRGCQCHVDPSRLHGPYYDWTRKVDGKTKTVRLDEKEALILEGWIDNMRKLEATISEMGRISLQAVDKIRK